MHAEADAAARWGQQIKRNNTLGQFERINYGLDDIERLLQLGRGTRQIGDNCGSIAGSVDYTLSRISHLVATNS